VCTGRTPSLTEDQKVEIRQKVVSGIKNALAHPYGISRETVYIYLRAETPKR
jgi:hypothetical protein